MLTTDNILDKELAVVDFNPVNQSLLIADDCCWDLLILSIYESLDLIVCMRNRYLGVVSLVAAWIEDTNYETRVAIVSNRAIEIGGVLFEAPFPFVCELSVQ